MNRKQKATDKQAIDKSFNKLIIDDKKLSAHIVLQNIQQEAKPLLKKLASLSVKSNEDYEKAAVIMKQVKELMKAAEAKEDTILDPLKQATKATKELFKPFYTEVMNTQIGIKAMMEAWLQKQEQAKAKLVEAVSAGTIKKESTVMRKDAELTVTSTASSVRKIPKLVCVDASLTPMIYLVPVESAIKNAILAGVEVPGWKVEMVNNISI